jgi:serine/threonine protein kinase/tetratricopeptide (TPR) repeat protein
MRRTFKLGRFAVYEMLGRGGSGVVAKATHLSTNVDVAVKMLSHRPEPQRLSAFHREVQAQASLGHPAIVYLFEYGEVDQQAASASAGVVSEGVPYVAMELAERGTLRDALPVKDWASLRSIVVQVLDALAFSHARGVIHRDIKPENLLVFDDGAGQRIKLADFGIAHATSHRGMQPEPEVSQFSGTPQYAAPEQIRGRWRAFGPPTDLYSLACVAWELICGRPPYIAENSLKTLMLQLDEPCPSLSPTFAVPAAMADWIRRAMSKKPGERFRTAAEAAHALPPRDTNGLPMLQTHAQQLQNEEGRDEQMEISTEWLPAVTTVIAFGGVGPVEETDGASEQSRARDRLEVPDSWERQRREMPTPLVGTGLELFGLRSIPFVGRSRERDIIWRQLADVMEGRGRRATLVFGDSGTGKSRLVEWMAERADELGLADPLVVRHTGAARDPSAGLADAVRDWAKAWHLDRASFFHRLEESLGELGVDADKRRDLARALTEYVHPTGEDEDEVDGPRFQFVNSEQRRTTLARFLELVASRVPLILVLDDLQWSSEALELLDLLLDEGAPSNMLLLGTIRTDVRASVDRLEARVEAVAEQPSCERLSLEPLSSSDHRHLLELMLPLRQSALDVLVERTEGNPLFGVHLLEELVDRGSLEMREDGFGFDDVEAKLLPDDIHALWKDRVDRLVDEFDSARNVRAAIELAAALGRDVDDGEWRAAVRAAGIDLPEGVVDRLVESGLARRGAQSWSFAHGMLVDSLARQAREAGRWRQHNAICARALADVYEGRRNQGGRRIAEHLVEAGRPEEALTHLETVYNDALTAARPEQAHDHVDRREELLQEIGAVPDDRRFLEVALARARIGTLTAEWNWMQTVLDKVLPESRRCNYQDLLVKALHIVGIYHWRHGEYDEAREALEEGLELEANRDGDNTLRLLLSLGWAEFSAGNLDVAWQHFRRTVDVAQNRGNVDRLLVGKRALAVADDHLGRRGAALEQLDEVLERAEERGYLLLVVSVHNALGDLYRYEGEFERAYEHTEAYAQVSDQMGVRISSRIALSNQAQVCIGMGRLDEAEAYIERLEDEFADRGVDSATSIYIRVLRLTLAAAREHWDELRERLEPYLERWPHDTGPERDHRWMLERATEFARTGAPPELVAQLEAVSQRLGGADG